MRFTLSSTISYVTTSVPEGGETMNDPSSELTDLSGVLYAGVIEVCGE
jgi:hypothetical protein